ncbi:MAG: lipase family protein [Chloroflexi bacterium]|nr:lipase family protein [Chloroflexota bacterium]
MKTNPIKLQEKKFADAQEKFEGARQEYFKAIEGLQAFAEPRLAQSTSLVMRAAYSDRVAWVMAVMAKLAYVEFESSEEELARLNFNLKSGGFELVSTFSKGSTQAFLAKNTSMYVLAFRGTEPKKIEDINADIRAYKLSTQQGRVHAGFQEAYDDVAEEIEKSFLKSESWVWPLYITGHSLGGALATVATQNLEHKIKSQIAACYTFGSPRVGNKNYERSTKAPFYRIVHSTDIVTLVPNIGFRHIGDARYLSYCSPDSEKFHFYRSIPFFRRLWEMLLAIVIPLNWPRWVTCHSMEEYERKLRIYAINRNK